MPTLKPSTTQCQQAPSKTYHENSPATQEHNLVPQYTGRPQSHQPTDISKLITGLFIALQREIQLHPPEHHTSFPNQKTLTSHRPTPPTVRNLHNKEEPPTARIQKGHPKHSNINKKYPEKYPAGKGTG